jgi:hypothetical protein
VLGRILLNTEILFQTLRVLWRQRIGGQTPQATYQVLRSYALGHSIERTLKKPFFGDTIPSSTSPIPTGAFASLQRIWVALQFSAAADVILLEISG